METNSTGSEKSIWLKLNSVVFCTVLIVGGLLFYVLPKQKISEDEKRRLTPFPEFSIEKLFSSQYTDSIDLYYSDNFTFRNQLISIAAQIKEMRGYADQKIQFYGGDELKKKETSQPNATSEEVDDDQPIEMPYENLKSIIIADKRAIQMFGGSRFSAMNYSNLLRSYKSTFKDSVKIHCMAIPVGSDFYLPAQLNKKKEKEFIDTLYRFLGGGGIACVNAYGELRKHKQDYIQFNTDHHWTGLGAYYAYQAFCKSAGFSPIPLEQMTRKVIPGFLGTLYYRTRSADLKENVDSVVYHKIPYETVATVYKSYNSKPVGGSLYYENAKGGNSYGVYLGSDYPMMRVVSPIKNGRRIAVFKDSYGNAFSPYLASHYEEVFILDYRYFDGDMQDLVKKFRITDILFAHNVYVLNSPFTISQEKKFLNPQLAPTKKEKNKP
jgi:hypothetical protein